MDKQITIRNEYAPDYDRVEALTRQAFWNLYKPGCDEHYLVHVMRSHEDFVPELDLVMEANGRIIGNIMYTRAWLVDEAGEEKPILTFGPLCIAPSHQRMGYGKKLLQHSFARAAKLGYDTIVIFGDPNNYVSRGFVSCRRHNICIAGGKYPAAMLVKELVPGVLDGRKWRYRDSPVMHLDEAAAQRFDAALPPMEKKRQPSQEAFYIVSHAVVEGE